MTMNEFQIGKKLYEDVIGAVYSFSSTETLKAGQIKILHEKLAKHDDLVKVFHTCAEKSCSIRNRHYISALSHGEGNGYHFILLEACNLTPLSILLKKTEVLSISDSIEAIETLANILRQAHIDEVIHNHLAPECIFSDINLKQFKINNFGFDEFSRLLIKKKQGNLLNTLPYYSPELIHGDKQLNRQSDIYPLGVLFYRLLVGELPWENYDVDDYLKNPYQRAVVPPSLQRLEVPELLDELVLEALEPALENRCPNMSQFIEKITETKKEVHNVDTNFLEKPGPETESSTPNQKIEAETDDSNGSIDQKINEINFNDAPPPESEETTELQNKAPEEEIDNEKKDETPAAQEEVSNQPSINSNSLEKEPLPQFEQPQQTTSDSETELAENKTSQLSESPQTISIPTERPEQKPVSESRQFSNDENEAKNPDLGLIQEKNEIGQNTKEENPTVTPEADEKPAEPNERNSIPSLATSTLELETGETPVSQKNEPQEHIPDNNISTQLENPQKPPSDPTAEDTTSAASPEHTILPEDPEQNSVSEIGQLSEGQPEIESQDIRFIQAKRDPSPTQSDENNANAQEAEQIVVETDEQNSSDFLAAATQESETVEASEIPKVEVADNTQDQDQKVSELGEAQKEEAANQQNVDSISLEKDTPSEIQKPVSENSELSNIEDKTAAKKEEVSNEPDVNSNSLETESPQLETPQKPLLETEKEFAENKTIQPEELPETKVSPPESPEQKPVSESTQLSNIESESQTQDVEPVPEFDPVTNDKHNSSAQEVDEEFTKSFIQQRDVEQNEQALKPEEENLWPDQRNNVGESVANQNQEDEIDQMVKSLDSSAPSSQLHTHENADQTKVPPPPSSNGGQKIGMPFSSKDETFFSKSSPKTSMTPNLDKKQFHGGATKNVLKTVLIALIPITVIYLLIAITFDSNLMNRLASLKERFITKKTESLNSSNADPTSQSLAAKPILQENNQIASTQPITSGKPGAAAQDLPPASELKLLLSVRGSGLAQASDIFVNGTFYGKTNNQGRILLSNLTVNQSYIIKIQKQGFEMWVKEVSFSTLGTKNLNVALRPLPSTAQSNGGQKIGMSTVTILLSNPQNVSFAFIYIDGKLWGGRDNIAPAKLQLPAGNHKVAVKRDGFRSHPTSQSLTLANGENRTIYFYLVPN